MKTPIVPLPSTLFAMVLLGASTSAANEQRLPLQPRGPDPDQVYFDVRPDGSLWAATTKYKAHFDGTGAEYLPMFGSKALRHYPVRFELSDVEAGGEPVNFSRDVSPSRSERTITYERGALVERYDMRPDSMEQTFVLSEIPSKGDLVLRVKVSTELAPSPAAEGWSFSNDLGAVVYGRAQAFDALGSGIEATTSFDGDSIVIRVPRSSLEGAVFPLTIDPVVTTFAVGGSLTHLMSPDIAFDGANGVYLVTYEQEVAGADRDCWCELYDTNGIYVPNSTVPIDISALYCTIARCADSAAAQEFYIVSHVGTRIEGRTRAANANTVGPSSWIDLVDTAEKLILDVGGDADPGHAGNFLVVWERYVNGTDHDIYARTVEAATGTPLGLPIALDTSVGTLDQHPSISKCNGHLPDTLMDWTVVWDRQVGANDHDILGAQVHWDGTITQPTYGISSGSADDWFPSVSSPLDGSASRPYMVVFARNTGGGSHDVQGAVFDGPFFLAQADLSTLEGSAFSGRDQEYPSVDSDGAAWAVAYSEDSGGPTDFDAYVSTFSLLGSTIQMAERHGQVSGGPGHEDLPRVVANYSGNGGRFRFGIVTEITGPNTVSGTLYDADTFASFCFPGVDGVAACPCANPGILGHGCDNSAATGGAILTKAGTGSLSGDTVVFTTHGEKPTALSVLLQGTLGSPAGVVYGQGIRCFAGTLKRLYAKSAVGGIITAPSGADPSISVRSAARGDTISAGSTRYYLVFYRDPVVLGGCPSGSTFNATQSGAICWRP